MRYGYARVSSEEQSLARQRSQLSAAGCDQFVEEVQSGVKGSPQGLCAKRRSKVRTMNMAYAAR